MVKGRLSKPAPLRMGDTVGVVAPGSPFDTATFQKGLELLGSRGYALKVSGACTSRQGYLAGSDRERARSFMETWTDPQVRAVLCARGGFGSMRLLPLLDYAALSAFPKILVGFSDITALLVTLTERCAMVTFHGPVVTSLAKGGLRSIRALQEAVSWPAPMVLHAEEPAVLVSGKAAGPVIGGNLTTLCHLAGTAYSLRPEGCLLFLEDRGEAPYRIDRMLCQMKMAGCLSGVVGVALGSFERCGSLEEVHRIFREMFAPERVPVLAGFTAGHTAENHTFPMGVRAELDTQDGVLRFLEPALAQGV